MTKSAKRETARNAVELTLSRLASYRGELGENDFVNTYTAHIDKLLADGRYILANFETLDIQEAIDFAYEVAEFVDYLSAFPIPSTRTKH